MQILQDLFISMLASGPQVHYSYYQRQLERGQHMLINSNILLDIQYSMEHNVKAVNSSTLIGCIKTINPELKEYNCE